MQCMVAMSRVDNAMLSAQFEFVQAKSNGGGENRACTQCFIILHAPTFVWHAWCPSQIRRALEELKGLLPNRGFKQLDLSTDQIPEPRNKGALLDTCNTHWSTQRIQGIQKIQKIRNECRALNGKEKDMGWQGFSTYRVENFKWRLENLSRSPSLPTPSEWSGGFAPDSFGGLSSLSGRALPGGFFRHTVCPATIWISHYAGIIETKHVSIQIGIRWNPWSFLSFHGVVGFLVVCRHKLYHDPAVLCHTSGSPHPEGPWGCDASYCLKQLQTIQSNPWSTDGLIGFSRFSTPLNEVTSKKSRILKGPCKYAFYIVTSHTACQCCVLQ